MKHFHGTPIGVSRIEAARFFRRRYFLIPWLHPCDLYLAAEISLGFCFDNSAFSLWKSGRSMQKISDWDGYRRLVLEWHYHPRYEFCLIPDLIDGEERENDELLNRWLDYGVKFSVPVWHLHESLSRLINLSKSSDMVAIGSSGDFKTPGSPAWSKRMTQAMKVICVEGKPRCRIHGLRMLAGKIVTKYPFYSGDSTSATQNASNVIKGTYHPVHKWQKLEIVSWKIESHQSPGVFINGTNIHD